ASTPVGDTFQIYASDDRFSFAYNGVSSSLVTSAVSDITYTLPGTGGTFITNSSNATLTNKTITDDDNTVSANQLAGKNVDTSGATSGQLLKYDITTETFSPSTFTFHSGWWLFGDGNDGDVTISSSTMLARDMYYNNLTVNAALR